MKVVSQESFDDIVLQNVTEFDNTLEEAIEEATKELEAQGVNTNNLVKNPRLNEDKTKIVHDVVEALSTVKTRSESSDLNQITAALKMITSQCKISIAHRVFACKHEGYETLLGFINELKDSGDNDTLSIALQTMGAVTDTNPDILTPEGVDLLMELLQTWSTRSDHDQVSLHLVRWCMECCLKHEANRQTLVVAGAPAHLKTLLLTKKSDVALTKASCMAMRSFTLDDDIRTEFGKAHDHARLLVEEHEMIKTCLEIVKEYVDNSDVTSEILSTLSRLCVRAEYCQEAVDNDALVVINDVLVSFPDSPQLNRQSINLLKTISGNDRVKDEIMKIGASQLIIGALVKHQKSPSVCEAALGAIGMLALRVESHAIQLIQEGAADAVVQAMKIHTESKQVQKLGCMAVRNLVCRNAENRKIFINCQVENVIQKALERFGGDYNTKDVAKAALRDLELEVQFEEQWKGTGVQMER